MLFRLPGHLLSLIALHCGNGGGWKRFSSICYWPASGRERACHQPRRRRPPRQFPSGSETPGAGRTLTRRTGRRLL